MSQISHDMSYSETSVQAYYDERRWGKLGGEGHQANGLIRWGILLDGKTNGVSYLYPAAHIQPLIYLPIPSKEFSLNPASIGIGPKRTTDIIKHFIISCVRENRTNL